MIKLTLYPPTGTIKDAKALKFKLDGVDSDTIRVHVENATHGTVAKVQTLQNIGDGTYMGIADIKIPDHLQQSSISIFANVEAQQKDGTYKTIQICPTIFTIKGDQEAQGELFVSSSYVGVDDLCSIGVKGEPSSTKIVSINDKFFKAYIKEDGFGSVSFKGKDVLGSSDINTVYQLPIYLYNDADNFTKKVSTDSYLNILPSDIAMHADIDPRCDYDNSDYVSPGAWTLPNECISNPNPPIISVPWPTVPPNSVPTICREETVDIKDSSTCRIFGHSAALLNNGMVMHAYLSPDKEVADVDDEAFNINKIFLAKQHTSLTVPVIANRDVVVEPKVPSENFTIHVEEDVWLAMEGVNETSDNDIHVVLFSTSIGFTNIKIIDRGVDEYTGSYILTGEMENDFLQINEWLFCVNAVFYHELETPDIYMNVLSNPINVPYITNSDGNPIQVTNIKIASNVDYIGLEEEIYCYLIAEAIDDGKSQLFFSSFVVGKDSSVDREVSPWFKLTYVGNNQNPVIKMGSDNNIHILWESDRSGLRQLYYGVMGQSVASSVCPAFSSCIDKYSEFISTGSVPFDYTSDNLLTSIGSVVYDPSDQIAEYGSSDLVQSTWEEYGSSGNVSQSSGDSYINDLTIEANALTEDAMAFNSLQIVDNIDNPSSYAEFPYSQFNYQISFNMEATVSQDSLLASDYDGTVMGDKDIDNIYDEWLSEFTLIGDVHVNNQASYYKNSNTFVIGRTEGIFDRIVPIVGSYKHDEANPSIDRFQIDITKQSNNLKDFTFGLMFEKVIFKSTNIYTAEEFEDINPSSISYDEGEIHTIYTGMAKLVAFIKTEDTETDRANYIIVREFPEKIDVSESKAYTIIANYTKSDSLGVSTLMDTYNQIYDNKFVSQVTLLIDGVARFSQSFISTISHDYNYFDIGFGIPYGGYYIADKMSPSKLGVFDDVSSTIIFRNIEISSPTYTYNPNIVTLSPSIRNMTKLRVGIDNPSVAEERDLLYFNINENGEETLESFSIHVPSPGVDLSREFDTSLADKLILSFITGPVSDSISVTASEGTILYDSGLVSYLQGSPLVVEIDISAVNSIFINVTKNPTLSAEYWVTADFTRPSSNTFSQIPLSFEGINQSSGIDIGKCDDVHVVWQSNRDKNWNIFYTNSVDKLSPFRFDTKITETESNSLKPSVSVNRNGKRLIVWHDDRNGNYDIFAARSEVGYSCDKEKCSREMAKVFDDNITECSIVMDYEAIAGTYYFALEFYTDAALNDLYTTIDINYNNFSRWFFDNNSVNLSYSDDGSINGIVLSYGGDIVVSYIPGKDDGIFDKVLYVKLTAESVTG